MSRFVWDFEGLRRFERLVDSASMAQKRAAFSGRRGVDTKTGLPLAFPWAVWASEIGCHENTVRKMFERGRCRMGSEDKGFYYVFDAALAWEDVCKENSKKGNKCLLDTRRRDYDFMSAVAFLCSLLLRKRCVKAKFGHYSVEACLVITKRKFPLFTPCLRTIWNWIAAGQFAHKGITLDTVRIWNRHKPLVKRSADLDKWAAKNKGHTIWERPLACQDSQHGGAECFRNGDLSSIMISN